MQAITENAPDVAPDELDPGADAGGSAKRNVGTLDRILRVSLGGVLVIWAFARLFAGAGVAIQLVDVALIALGADFVVTGIRGHCPLYQRLGWSTAKARRRK